MIDELAKQLQKTIDFCRTEFSRLQLGRASAALVEEIDIEVYGSKVPLKNNAQIFCPDAKTLRIEPWDKSIMANAEKAIIQANIGLNPQNMGDYILIPIPPMTEERRKQTVKLVKDETEKLRISIRNIRHDFLQKTKRQKDANEISEDEQKRLEKQIDEKISETNRTIDVLSKKKEEDVLRV
jgi:ribosome recycling factor